ncbi:MAG: hypothetical protein ACE5IJ_08895 [Thermoplasmata archaeon]
MAETGHEESSWGLVGWLSLVLAIGNLVFANLFIQFMGFIGLPLGVGVAALLTLVVFFILRRRNGTT